MPDKRTVPAVLYAAKSTEDKHGSIPDQLAKTARLSGSEDWRVVDEFSDEGFSAYSGNRGPDLEKAKALAIQLAADHGECFLVALHSDRIARGAGDAPGAADHLVEVVAFLRRHGVRLRTVEDDFFADDRIGLLMAAVQGQRNTEDSRRKSESVSAGLRRRAKERGLFTGPAPYGYAWHESGDRIVVVDAEAAVIGRIFSEFVAGHSMTRIAQDLHRDGVPTKSRKALWRQAQISGIVRNPVYVGKVKHKEDLFDGQHEPIIESDLWNQAQQILDGQPSRRGRPPKEKRHLFTNGFLRCGRCGDPMCPRTRRNYEFYECMGRIHGCKTGAIRRSDIDERVLAHFEQVALDVEATREALTAATDRRVKEAKALLAVAESEAQEAAARLSRVKRDYTDGELTASEWRALRADLEPEAAAAEAEADRLRAQMRDATSDAALEEAEAQVVELLSDLRSAIAGEIKEAADVDALRAVLHRLFDRFVLHPGPPGEAHVELIDGNFWIEPVVSERAVAGYDEKERPWPAREPLQQAGNNYSQASGWL